jgi:hypothetical protein
MRPSAHLHHSVALGFAWEGRLVTDHHRFEAAYVGGAGAASRRNMHGRSRCEPEVITLVRPLFFLTGCGSFIRNIDAVKATTWECTDARARVARALSSLLVHGAGHRSDGRSVSAQ